MVVVARKQRVMWAAGLVALMALAGAAGAAQSVRNLFFLPKWTTPTGISRPPLITPTRPPLISPIRP